MTRDEVAALFARRQEAWDRRDASALTEDYAESGMLDSPLAGGSVTGRAAIEKVYQALFTAFPDMKFQSEELIIAGDRAAQLAWSSGTDRGGFMGLPPSGKAFRVPMALFYVLREGEIVSERRILDFTGVLVQVGVLKARSV